jgi:hypothetical protein
LMERSMDHITKKARNEKGNERSDENGQHVLFYIIVKLGQQLNNLSGLMGSFLEPQV